MRESGQKGCVILLHMLYFNRLCQCAKPLLTHMAPPNDPSTLSFNKSSTHPGAVIEDIGTVEYP